MKGRKGTIRFAAGFELKCHPCKLWRHSYEQGINCTARSNRSSMINRVDHPRRVSLSPVFGFSLTRPHAFELLSNLPSLAQIHHKEALNKIWHSCSILGFGDCIPEAECRYNVQ